MADAHASPLPPPGYRTQSEDTSYWAERLLFDHWRALSPVEKAEIGRQACLALHQGLIAGLRVRHPNASDDELELRAAIAKYGADTMRRTTGLGLPAE
jgi:hypothetical protein